jgi:hypothetical protein
MTPDKLRQSDPRAFDAAVAERVHGAKRYATPSSDYLYILDEPMGGPALAVMGSTWWQPHEDPAADYLTLKLVRETWNKDRQAAFHKALCRVWGLPGRPEAVVKASWKCLQYVPGDWSAAALSVVDASPGREREGDERRR